MGEADRGVLKLPVCVCVCVNKVHTATVFVFGGLLPLCVMKFGCAPLFRTRVTSAQRSFPTRGERMEPERRVAHDHGRLSMWR